MAITNLQLLNLETVLLILSLINSVIIGIMVIKRKWIIAFSLALLQAIIIGGSIVF